MNALLGPNTHRRHRAGRLALVPLLCALGAMQCLAQGVSQPLRPDSRIRTVPYSADEVYRLRGFVGYQIDLEFETGENFVGLGTGDVEALAFAAQDNHLFVKPKAPRVRTNLTVLTTRRAYQFDYEVSPGESDGRASEMIYTLRFAYPTVPAVPRLADGADVGALDFVSTGLPKNQDYWYCGHAGLQPLRAFDDGVHTHLQFDPRAELPAVFVSNEDGTESLLNYNVQQGELVIHRLARRFVLRRGRLVGCIVNKGFDGSGGELRSGTVTTEVERTLRHDGP